MCRYFQSKNCVYQGRGRDERRSRVKHLLLRTPKMVTRYCAPLCAVRRPPPSLPFFLSFFLPPPSCFPAPSRSLLSSPIPSINQRQVMAIFASISLLGSGANSAAAAAPYLEWPIGGERRREERGRGREWRIMPPPQRHCHPRARNLPSEQSGAPELFLFIGETSSTL